MRDTKSGTANFQNDQTSVDSDQQISMPSISWNPNVCVGSRNKSPSSPRWRKQGKGYIVSDWITNTTERPKLSTNSTAKRSCVILMMQFGARDQTEGNYASGSWTLHPFIMCTPGWSTEFLRCDRLCTHQIQLLVISGCSLN